MKIAFNETQPTVILNGGRLELQPKGSPGQKDRRQIADSVAELPDVKRFTLLGKISVLSLEDAAKRDADVLRGVADVKATIAVKASKDADKAKAVAEAAAAAVPPAPPTEVKTAEPVPPAEKPEEKPEEKSKEDSSEHRRPRRRSGRH